MVRIAYGQGIVSIPGKDGTSPQESSGLHFSREMTRVGFTMGGIHVGHRELEIQPTSI